MKSQSLRILTLASLLSVSSLAICQSVQRTDQDGTPAPKGRHHANPSNKQDLQAVRALCRRAAQTLSEALPIYHSHRVNAMHLLRQAAGEVEEAINSAREAETAEARHYNPAAVAASNAKLQRALQIAQRALTLLNKIQPVGDGSDQRNAAQYISNAISEIQAGLATVGAQPTPSKSKNKNKERTQIDL